VLFQLCEALARGGAGDAATHIRQELESGKLEAGSLLTASLHRDQGALRTGAVHRGLSPDLMWLIAELAVSPFAHALQRMLFGAVAAGELREALDAWNHGYCPACGSWPAVGEVAAGHRTLRCSFCSCAWELNTYACIYCENSGEGFVTAAPDAERKDRRIEVCSGCGGYLKTIDLPELSPFPLLSISDIETTDLDVAAMEHGYSATALKDSRASLNAENAETQRCLMPARISVAAIRRRVLQVRARFLLDVLVPASCRSRPSSRSPGSLRRRGGHIASACRTRASDTP
jgi:hypothetical protein